MGDPSLNPALLSLQLLFHSLQSLFHPPCVPIPKCLCQFKAGFVECSSTISSTWYPDIIRFHRSPRQAFYLHDLLLLTHTQQPSWALEQDRPPMCRRCPSMPFAH